ncbi:MAG TPA: phosphopantetheine-binding protein, partial [Casimicrobiaceae bacterium]
LELGGDSLLAAQIVARVLRDFAVDLPLDTLLAAASVRSMAATLIAARNDAANMDNLLSEIKPCLRSGRA